MPTYTNIQGTDPNAPASTYLRQPIIMRGGVSNTEPYVIPWIATARTGESLTGTIGSPIQEATRTRSECYMVGLGENIRLETSSALPWVWRRICFTLKGTYLIQNAAAGTYYQGVTSNGYTRTASSMLNGGGGKGAFYDFVFEGTGPSDWLDPLYAQLDRRNITVKYDKTQTIRSQNDVGNMTSRKIFHPMRKNLVYGDDQIGGNESMSPLSTFGKPGMGDYYVIDFFRPQLSATTTDQLRVDYESTLYWHER